MAPQFGFSTAITRSEAAAFALRGLKIFQREASEAPVVVKFRKQITPFFCEPGPIINYVSSVQKSI